MGFRAAILAVLLPSYVSAQVPVVRPDVIAQEKLPAGQAVSSDTAKPRDFGWLRDQTAHAAGGPGNGRTVPFIPLFWLRMDEGPQLETLLWGGQGAVIGAFAGPVGAAVGGAVGAVTGFIIGMVYAPKDGAKAPSAKNYVSIQ